ncbi:helix-turn-helix transcriptional regulator [Paenibacillus sp. GCM10027627]|uniref:helix-turn-helix transcriptional regulator n=1 Tax=unclassified Paenibacillus TaxID=185978 RepID=UPI003644BB31
MKLERLLSIIILLLNRRIVQAKELADRFEVSVRTIYRDIDAINAAGIPIVTYQGANGGIGLSEGYRLDRNVLTSDELAAIVTALQSISTSYDSEPFRGLVEKMNSVVPTSEADHFRHKANGVLIDFSPWDGNEKLKPKLILLKDAVDNCRLAEFAYSSPNGDITHRTVEPHRLILKGKHWYLQAYCLEKEQFRLFKLKRMKDMRVVEGEIFLRRELPRDEDLAGQTLPVSSKGTEFVLRFHADSRFVAEEFFGVEELMPMDDGGWLVRKVYREDEWLYSFILSLGHHAEVLEPSHLREIIADRARRIADMYKTGQPT